MSPETPKRRNQANGLSGGSVGTASSAPGGRQGDRKAKVSTTWEKKKTSQTPPPDPRVFQQGKMLHPQVEMGFLAWFSFICNCHQKNPKMPKKNRGNLSGFEGQKLCCDLQQFAMNTGENWTTSQPGLLTDNPTPQRGGKWTSRTAALPPSCATATVL